MYARYIKITFKDKLAKEMMITYSNSVADAEGIKNGLLLRFTIDQSELTAILVLVFANYEDFNNDHKNVALPVIESCRNQGLKVELADGNVVGDIAASTKLVEFLKKKGTFYNV